ncbi:hypothetical protein [Brevundimonas sp.]|uniref:hypothetical protein n=1 Tax=Brevundimonas sp. TaxID=1871086 RepID=UPI0035B45C25
MTDLVIQPYSPGGLTDRAARREIIDFIAARMAFKKGRSWNRMTAARQEQMREQARTALRALAYLPHMMFDAESFIAVAASEAVDDGADAITVGRHAEAYLREVLK